jgi:hypothetical protein
MVDKRFRLGLCRHEAAHAIVSTALGVPVLELRVDDPEPGTHGWCLSDGDAWRSGRWGGRPLECLAMLVAPQVWAREFEDRRDREPAAAYGSDNQSVERIQREVLPAGEPALRRDHRRRAEALAARVLVERQDDVRTIAAKLQAHGGWVRGVGWGLPPRRTAAPVQRSAPPAARPPAVAHTGQDAPVSPLRAAVGDSLARSLADEQRREFMLDVRDRVAKQLITSDEAYRLCRAAGYQTEFRLRAC